MRSPFPAIKPKTAPLPKQTGVGLIEVLVTILVVSIGLLGMAALQTKALSTNNSAMSRSVAVLATYSILEAMRADRTSAMANTYNQTVTPNPQAPNSCLNVQGPALTQVHMNAWCGQLAQLGAVATTTGNINCDAAGACTITITYDDSRAGQLTNGAGAVQVGLPNQTVVTNTML